ncbi:MAG TPA: hypothetical protein VN939_19910 [Chthoniobacterales bacterium]|nr:hypothetical protein [Chthoniobacterales bacterium]
MSSCLRQPVVYVSDFSLKRVALHTVCLLPSSRKSGIFLCRHKARILFAASAKFIRGQFALFRFTKTQTCADF